MDAILVAGEAVDMGGICQLGEDIGVDAATDVSILVLCWKLGAKVKPGHIMEAEWMEGMEALGADSADKVGRGEKRTRVMPVRRWWCWEYVAAVAVLLLLLLLHGEKSVVGISACWYMC